MYRAHRGPAGSLTPLVGHSGGQRITSLHQVLVEDMIDVRVAASGDVADGETANWTPNVRTPMYLVRSGATGSFAFWRFTLDIPQGATIVNAFLTVYQNELATYASADDRTLGAVQADNPAAPGNASAMSAAAGNLGTTVTWANAGSFANQAALPTGDIKAVLQQLVDRAGWASGNAVLLVATHPGSGSKTHQQRAFDSTPTLRPRLEVEFSYWGAP